LKLLLKFKMVPPPKMISYLLSYVNMNGLAHKAVLVYLRVFLMCTMASQVFIYWVRLCCVSYQFQCQLCHFYSVGSVSMLNRLCQWFDIVFEYWKFGTHYIHICLCPFGLLWCMTGV
jgi:hypothetical protein